MKKGKIIIHFDGVDEEEAMRYVDSVVRDGRVSSSPAGPQYCYVSTWTPLDGSGEVAVYAYRYKSGTDVFKVVKKGPE